MNNMRIERSQSVGKAMVFQVVEVEHQTPMRTAAMATPAATMIVQCRKEDGCMLQITHMQPIHNS